MIGLLEPMKKSMVPVQVQLDAQVVKVASGECWAHWARASQHSSALRQALPVLSGNDHLVMLTDDGDLYTLGCGEQGQLGRVPELFANRGGRQGLGKCF